MAGWTALRAGSATLHRFRMGAGRNRSGCRKAQPVKWMRPILRERVGPAASAQR
ncbi:protein of unassigned function [Methylobacterium oryzae CBMB20]|uniref:Protein of unassigned function n=1 Tax=Methylobacterium oryzae CBMB20 TaxID=693986 RepID=A0A089Q3A3_9HYPH|nr:protein of unassigned function [Methylobacterium oryzae CBMB20]